jgi:hypothetical protein
LQLVAQPDLSPEARAIVQRNLDRYRATAARYESEPDTGEGKQELLTRAHAAEARRERAHQQDNNFDYAVALFQIAIVVGSVSLAAASRWLLGASIALGVVASLMMINGYFLLVKLPFA